MKIEEAIKQPKFEDEWQKAIINLMYTHNWLVDQIKKSLKGYGITVQQYNVLRILRGQHPKPISTANIRDRMLDRMSDASRIVDRLQKKGLVERNTCPSDKRLVDVRISKDGLALLSNIDPTMSNFDQFMNKLSEADARTLNSILDKVRETED